jgi:hypothetical protein
MNRISVRIICRNGWEGQCGKTLRHQADTDEKTVGRRLMTALIASMQARAPNARVPPLPALSK